MNMKSISKHLSDINDDDPVKRILAAKALGDSMSEEAVGPLGCLLAHKDEDLRVEAVSALAKLGEVATDQLICALGNSSWYVRCRAAEALGKHGLSIAIKPLCDLLEDSSQTVRQAAARSLGLIGDPDAARQLVLHWVGSETPNALHRIGAAAIPTYVELLTHPDADTRATVFFELRDLGWQPASDAELAYVLAAGYKYSDAAELGEVALAPLTLAAQTLREWDASLKLQLVTALRKLGTQAAPVLVTIVSDPNREVAMAAAQALEELGWSPEEESLTERLVALKRLDEVKRQISNGRMEEVISLGSEAVMPLTIILDERTFCYDITKAMIEALGTIGDPRALGSLISFCERRDAFGRYIESEYLRQAAEEVWMGLKDPSVAEEIVLRLKKPEREHSNYGEDSFVSRSHQALLKLSGLAVPALIGMLEDDDASLRMLAAQILGEIDDPRAVEPLLEALNDSYVKVKQTAVFALCQIGDPRAVEPLTLMLKDYYTAEVATKALSALGDLSAVEPLVEELFTWTKVREDGSWRDVGPLVRGLEKVDRGRSSSGAEALTPLGAAVVERLRDISANSDKDTQTQVSRILEAFKQKYYRAGSSTW